MCWSLGEFLALAIQPPSWVEFPTSSQFQHKKLWWRRVQRDPECRWFRQCGLSEASNLRHVSLPYLVGFCCWHFVSERIACRVRLTTHQIRLPLGMPASCGTVLVWVLITQLWIWFSAVSPGRQLMMAWMNDWENRRGFLASAMPGLTLPVGKHLGNEPASLCYSIFQIVKSNQMFKTNKPKSYCLWNFSLFLTFIIKFLCFRTVTLYPVVCLIK